MTFQEVLAKLSLSRGNSGFSLDLAPRWGPDPDEKRAYLTRARQLEENPVLVREVEDVIKTLVDDMQNLQGEEVKACKMTIQAMIALLDRISYLADECRREVEEKEGGGDNSLEIPD